MQLSFLHSPCKGCLRVFAHVGRPLRERKVHVFGNVSVLPHLRAKGTIFLHKLRMFAFAKYAALPKLTRIKHGIVHQVTRCCEIACAFLRIPARIIIRSAAPAGSCTHMATGKE